MNIQASLIFDKIPYVFSRQIDSLDRNYDDEGYAYFLESMPNTEDGLFEINVLKEDANGGKLIEDGYVSVYSSSDQVMPDDIIDTVITLSV